MVLNDLYFYPWKHKSVGYVVQMKDRRVGGSDPSREWLTSTAQGFPTGTSWGLREAETPGEFEGTWGPRELCKRLHNYGKSPFVMGKLTISGNFP